MEQRKRIRLDEVTLMRCVLAVLIVFMHAFTCYDGSWHEPIGYVDVPLYKWLARWSFAFTLEGFVFISGYLYGFQRVTLKRTCGSEMIQNKLKRLMLPSVIFSIVYFSIFYQYKGVGDMLYSIINGCGHMWFLPMLFWCFMGVWQLDKIKIGDNLKIGFLVFLNLFSVYYFPLRLTDACLFMVYFYGGYVVYKNNESMKLLITKKRIYLGIFFFVIVFSTLRPLRDYLIYSNGSSTFYKIAFWTGNRLCQSLYASIGLFVFYSIAVYYTRNHQLKSITIKLSSCCFGIYLFQQFFLQYFYYRTSLPVILGPYLLPWVGFCIAAILSFIITYILLKTKSGKLLLG